MALGRGGLDYLLVAFSYAWEWLAASVGAPASPVSLVPLGECAGVFARLRIATQDNRSKAHACRAALSASRPACVFKEHSLFRSIDEDIISKARAANVYPCADSLLCGIQV